MSEADILKWNGKYGAIATPVAAEPDDELSAYAALIPRKGRALDLACGLGKNTLFLAKYGLAVDAIDGSIEALNRLQASARASGLDQRVLVRQADLDGYTLAECAYDLILVVRYLNRDLLPGIASALKPGGILIYKTFNRNILKQRPGFNLAYTIETTELIDAFPMLEMITDNREVTSSEYAFMIARQASKYHSRESGNPRIQSAFC